MEAISSPLAAGRLLNLLATHPVTMTVGSASGFALAIATGDRTLLFVVAAGSAGWMSAWSP
jgi:hypothetical protein